MIFTPCLFQSTAGAGSDPRDDEGLEPTLWQPLKIGQSDNLVIGRMLDKARFRRGLGIRRTALKPLGRLVGLNIGDGEGDPEGAPR